MPAPWNQEFDFYIDVIDDAPTSVVIDLAAAPHLPLVTHATALLVSVPMHRPLRNGLRSEEEFEAMSAVEDTLVGAVEQHASAIYWGRHVHSGRTDFFFQLEGEPGTAQHAELGPYLQLPDYDAHPTFRSDPDWELYRASYPTPYLQHTMANRSLQQQLGEQGDRLNKRRIVDHMALFPSRGQAEEAARRLIRRRFRIESIVDSGDGGSHALEFRRKDSCKGSRPDQVTGEILEAIEPSGGTYDGWGCQLTR